MYIILSSFNDHSTSKILQWLNYWQKAILFILVILVSCKDSEHIEVKLDKILYNEDIQIATVSLSATGNRDTLDVKVIPRLNKTWKSDMFSIKNYEVGIKSGNIKYNGSEIMLAIIDENNNDKFDDYGTDLMYVGSVVDSISLSSSEYVIDTLKKDSKIRIDNHIFGLSGFLERAEDLKIQFIATEDQEDVRFEYSNFLSNVRVKSLDNNYLNWEDYIGKYEYIIIDAWYIGCSGCEKIAPILHDLEQKYKGKIKVLSLNI